MRHQRLTYACSLSLALVLGLSVSPAWAQWAWRDANGTVQYSDAPPPSSVPQDRIVRQPGNADVSPSRPAGAAQESSTPGWVEQNAEFMKRREQRQEQDKEKREQKLAAENKKKNCNIARENLRMMETGRPIRQASDQGGMEIMNENQRDAEMARMRDHLKDCR